MRSNMIETVMGGVVLLVAGFFLVFAYSSADLGEVRGYQVEARFSSIGGLQVGSDVRISGVKVGTVTAQALDLDTFQAVVYMSIDPGVRLPRDTVAIIASESLLGGKVMALEPGGDPEMIGPGGVIEYTQAAVNLEDLLGRFMFSSSGSGAPHATPGADPGAVGASEPDDGAGGLLGTP